MHALEPECLEKDSVHKLLMESINCEQDEVNKSSVKFLKLYSTAFKMALERILCILDCIFLFKTAFACLSSPSKQEKQQLQYKL